MKLKANSKHKFDTTAFMPGQALRGTIKQSKLMGMTQHVDMAQALKALQLGPDTKPAKK